MSTCTVTFVLFDEHYGKQNVSCIVSRLVAVVFLCVGF